MSFKKGSITLFLALTISIILLLVIFIIESCRIEGIKTRSYSISHLSVQSAFSCYARELFDKYGIYAFYGTDQSFIDSILFYSNKSLTNSNTLTDSKIKEVSIDQLYRLTDNYGKGFAFQITEFQKIHGVCDVIDRLNDDKDICGDISTDISKYNDIDITDISSETLIELKKLESSDSQEDEAVTTTTKKSISEKISSFMQSNLLYILKPLSMAVSKYKIQDSLYELLPSVINEKSQFNTTVLYEDDDSIIDLSIFNSYLVSHFSTLKTEINSDIPLKYQIEFILSGKQSDEECLLDAVTQILALRTGLNLLHIIKDPQKRSSCNKLAASTMSMIPLPFGKQICQFLIMNLWSIGEAIIDVRDLLDDKKVPLIKSSDIWTLSLNQIAELSPFTKSKNSGKNGLSYDEYLYMLLITGEPIQFYYRTMDLIQLDMITNYNTDFNFFGCISGAKMNFTIESSPLFKINNVFNLPDLYNFTWSIVYGYD